MSNLKLGAMTAKIIYVYEDFTREFIWDDAQRKYIHLWDDYSRPGNPSDAHLAMNLAKWNVE